MANAKLDDNGRNSLIAVSNADGSTVVRLYADPVTHRLLVDLPSSTGTFVTNEVVSGSGTTFTLAHTPIAGSQAVYGNGQRLTPGAGNDYQISGAVLTMANSYLAGQILADYRF